MLQGPNGRSNKGVEGVQEGSVAPAGRKTLETLGAADSIAEALEMAANERKRHEVSLAFLISSINLSACTLLLLLLLLVHSFIHSLDFKVLGPTMTIGQVV